MMKTPTSSSLDGGAPSPPGPTGKVPQSEAGGVSAVLGVAILFMSACVAILHIAFAERDPASTRWLVRIEAAFLGGTAALGLLLALRGLLQRTRRHGAAVFGLILNLLWLALAALGWLLA